jgi:peptidoglycan/xylan/chitin deacetylase (PgdA/CDA1 family)
MKTHGDAGWTEYPSYLDIVVPRVLRFLEERALRITFFVVGQDAALRHNQQILRSISEAGHEIGNHSFRHEPWLHLYSPAEMASELEAAETAIETATGHCPRGFRGPGFSVSDGVIDALIARGYQYDASTLPTFLGPLARLYYFFTAKLSDEEKHQRSKLYGTLRDGLRPLQMHRWHASTGSITEIPVTTMPLFRLPFHLSYLIYLAAYSRPLADLYLRMALTACRWRNVPPSFLLHPLDFLGPSEAPELSFFPGMRLPLETKLRVATDALSRISSYYDLVPMCVHAAQSAVVIDPAPKASTSTSPL